MLRRTRSPCGTSRTSRTGRPFRAPPAFPPAKPPAPLSQPLSRASRAPPRHRPSCSTGSPVLGPAVHLSARVTGRCSSFVVRGVWGCAGILHARPPCPKLGGTVNLELWERAGNQPRAQAPPFLPPPRAAKPCSADYGAYENGLSLIARRCATDAPVLLSPFSASFLYAPSGTWKSFVPPRAPPSLEALTIIGF